MKKYLVQKIFQIYIPKISLPIRARLHTKKASNETKKKSERSERAHNSLDPRFLSRIAKERAALWNSRCERGAIELIGAAYTRRTDNIMHCRLRSQHDRELISKIINWTYSGSRLASGFKGKLGLIKRSAYERASERANQPDRRTESARGKRTISCISPSLRPPDKDTLPVKIPSSKRR